MSISCMLTVCVRRLLLTPFVWVKIICPVIAEPSRVLQKRLYELIVAAMRCVDLFQYG